MAKKQFKAESKRLLDMMINSIYTHKEIFLRELISNASDAIDKLYFKSLTDSNVGIAREDFKITLAINKQNRTLTITDNGIGMTADELEKNLGVIAKSGSFDFKEQNEKKDNIDIIGQFGVGFYSAFMVASKVTVKSKAYGSDEAFEWTSNGTQGYEVKVCDKQSVGTEIELVIKDNTDEESYDEYLEQYRIMGIVKKYSNYIRYPIVMDVEHEKLKEGSDNEYETEIATETLNSMVPIWRKNKSDITLDEYNAFYKETFFDTEEPVAVIHSKTEGSATYNALMYIPSRAPYNYYTKDFEKGLQLYASGVLIMDKCSDLLPDYFSFVKGLVDSEDLSLNISRELLQHDRQLKLIAKSIEKKIKNELEKLQKTDRDKYVKFFEAFGLQLKFGLYNNYGMNKDTLKDLVMFYSSSEKKLVTLAEYTQRMKEGQEFIFFASGESIDRIDNLPQTELLKDKGYEILYLTDNVDEFALQMLFEYDGKKFKSASAGDLDLESTEEKEQNEKTAEQSKDLFTFMQEALKDKVSTVRLSQRLKTHPVCITSDGEISLEMEKVINQMPTDAKVKAKRVLEINAKHPIFEKLKSLFESDKELLKTYSEILYTQALMIEGISVDDPVDYSNKVCELLVK